MHLHSVPVEPCGYSAELLDRLCESPMLRTADVVERLTLSVSHVPAPVPVTSHARRWVAHEIEDWLRDRTLLSLREAKACGVLRFPVLGARRSAAGGRR